MFPWIGAAGSALSLLNTVLKSGTASGTAQTGNNLFSSLGQALTGNSGSEQTSAVTGSGQGAPSLSSGTLATLISLQGQDGTNGQRSLFSKLDTNGNGSISKSEFEKALGQAGVDSPSADALFSKLDTNGDGSISQGEFTKAMHAAHGGHGHHGGGKGGLSQLLNSTDATGATTQTSTNADGSSTTTITYQDGSTVTMTTPAPSSQNGGSSGTGSSGTNQSNLLQQLIRLQSQLAAQHGAAATSTTA